MQSTEHFPRAAQGPHTRCLGGPNMGGVWVCMCMVQGPDVQWRAILALGRY